MKKPSLFRKILAFALIFAFAILPLSSINSHSYSIKGGVEICKHDCMTPLHLSYYCDYYKSNILF